MGDCPELRREMPRRLSHVARSIARTQGSEADLCTCTGVFACSRDFTGRGRCEGGKEMNERGSGDQRRQGVDYGETADVHQVHSAIQREKREPRAGLEPLSIW